ncbi:DNA polymerase III, delta subunit [Prevotella aff. ruminicola Tc2-24]|jgi:DNA polymerase-3 subunit delta|uniref:DNA polymerase III subunit delta n=1 Tax=Prevotella aff. ruminicola Tc2-24 TaxID=81582 RepID=A0A1I0Q141_9BACT|nr:DNA polymerase III subunit delta [Prevotella aff. ruminicola Tc2-24]SEW20244.1 DNA polymerase III, delta subunit [Prevotella aff. ruminicola Tc2-24]
MPEAKNVSFETIMRDLKARKFMPVYYLMGDEPYYIDQIADYIADHVLQPEERDFNQTILFGSDTTASQIADAARRYPMMSEFQVLIVKEAQNVKNTEALEKYFKAPLKSTILVMCHKNGTIDGRKKEYVKAIQTAGVLFESKKLRDRDLPAYIESYLQDRQVSIDPKSVQMIADNIGADLSRLTGELEKLMISLPEQDRRVTPQIVEDQIGISKDFNGFELRDAIVSKNVYKANLIIKYFDENPKAGNIYSFLPMLFNYFQNLMIAYYAPNNKSQEAVAEWLELRSPWAAKDYMTGMRNYAGMKVMQIISKMREIDAKSKGLDNPNTPPGELMKELIFYILH